MRRFSRLSLTLLILATGCNRGPYLASQPMPNWSQTHHSLAMRTSEDLQRRATDLDSNNRDLHAQLAQSQQQSQLLREQLALLQKQLQETTKKWEDERLVVDDAKKRINTLLASQQRGGATITANSSVRRSLEVVQLPGFDVQQVEDVIRIRVPADQVFVANSAQLSPAAAAVLDQIATAVGNHYPKQLVGIEAHTDSTAGAGSAHSLTSQQALAVFDHFARRNRFPERQLFIVSQGANHPRASNATPAGRTANRRVEIVIYPETIES